MEIDVGIKTAIEYTSSTVNPVMGCIGCELFDRDPAKNLCYAADLCGRYVGGRGWPAEFTSPEYFPRRLKQAIRWSDLTGQERPSKPWLNGMPRIVFVNDLSDGACPGGIDPAVWLLPDQEAMGQSPHIWLILTKWPRRLWSYFAMHPAPPNFWIGTTLTGLYPGVDQKRVHDLLSIKATRHWLSVEPLLGDVAASFQPEVANIDWIVGGGASGRNAPHTRLDHTRSLREVAHCWGIPFFWKQWGEWAAGSQVFGNIPAGCPTVDSCDNREFVYRVGKKRAGRVLDGVVWNEMPEQRPTQVVKRASQFRLIGIE